MGSECTFAFTESDDGGLPVKVVINPDVVKSHGVEVGDNINYLNLSAAQGGGAGQGTCQLHSAGSGRGKPPLLGTIFRLGITAFLGHRCHHLTGISSYEAVMLVCPTGSRFPALSSAD